MNGFLIRVSQVDTAIIIRNGTVKITDENFIGIPEVGFRIERNFMWRGFGQFKNRQVFGGCNLFGNLNLFTAGTTGKD